MNATHYDEVLALLADYHHGLYHLDLDRLRKVFTPEATYATVVDGSLLGLTIEAYFDRLTRRTAPAEEGVDSNPRVRSIRFAGENTALAEVESSMFGHDYHDFLSLLRVDGRWRVQSKVFEGVPHSSEEGS